MTSHLSIYVIINLKFSIVKLPKAIMAERSVLVKRELISIPYTDQTLAEWVGDGDRRNRNSNKFCVCIDG